MDTTDIRKNLKIMENGQPYVIIDATYVKPGKGQAFTRVKMRGLVTGSVLEKTYKSGEKVEVADVEQREMQYIYPEGDTYVFMDPSSGDQQTVPADMMKDEARFLADGATVQVTMLNGAPIGIELPPHVNLEVTASDPGIKGDTASGATKPATLSTGAVVNVPLFINEGDWLKVDTRTGQYLERVKK